MILSLPAVRPFFEIQLGPFKTRPNRAGWALNRCPWHQSKSGRSFAVNFESGGWICFAGCGKGDLIDFVKRRYNVDFKGALRILGIDGRMQTATPKKRESKSPARLLAEAVVDGAPENPERAERIRLREEIHVAAAIFGKAEQRLSELQCGAEESYADGREDCWEVMHLAFSDLRQTEAEYMRAAGFRECELP